jgi:hypothetical protein
MLRDPHALRIAFVEAADREASQGNSGQFHPQAPRALRQRRLSLRRRPEHARRYRDSPKFVALLSGRGFSGQGFEGLPR